MRYFIQLILLLIVNPLAGQNCNSRPAYLMYEGGLRLFSYDGTKEELRLPNNDICAKGTILEDCNTENMTFSVTFPILTSAFNVEYELELFEINSSLPLQVNGLYHSLTRTARTRVHNHYQGKEYSTTISCRVKPNHTYRVRLKWRKKSFGFYSWQYVVSNTWNVYPYDQSQEEICPYGGFDSANCFVSVKPSNGFIYNNCFYVTPASSNICPTGTTFENGVCIIDNVPGGNSFESGIILLENKLCKPVSNASACSSEVVTWNFSGTSLPCCVVYSPPWGHTIKPNGKRWMVNTTPVCPPNSGYDGANCQVNCAPCGRSAFEYEGNWYYTRNRVTPGTSPSKQKPLRKQSILRKSSSDKRVKH